MFRFGLALILTSLVTSAAGREPDRRPSYIVVHGAGGASCGQYLEHRKYNDKNIESVYQNWAAGYFAGYLDAITKPGTTNDLSIDLPTYTAWLDKWCGDDPSSNVLMGLINLRLKKLGR